MVKISSITKYSFDLHETLCIKSFLKLLVDCFEIGNTDKDICQRLAFA